MSFLALRLAPRALPTCCMPWREMVLSAFVMESLYVLTVAIPDMAIAPDDELSIVFKDVLPGFFFFCLRIYCIFVA